MTPEIKRQKCTWSSALQCGWSAWRVLDDGELALDMQPDDCCDMDGAIRVAQAMMPNVWRIVTFTGGVLDTEYRFWQGKWSAYTQKMMPKRCNECRHLGRDTLKSGRDGGPVCEATSARAFLGGANRMPEWCPIMQSNGMALTGGEAVRVEGTVRAQVDV